MSNHSNPSCSFVAVRQGGHYCILLLPTVRTTCAGSFKYINKKFLVPYHIQNALMFDEHPLLGSLSSYEVNEPREWWKAITCYCFCQSYYHWPPFLLSHDHQTTNKIPLQNSFFWTCSTWYDACIFYARHDKKRLLIRHFCQRPSKKKNYKKIAILNSRKGGSQNI